MVTKRILKGNMEANMEQTPETNLNPILSVAKDGTVLYSNEAGEPLLHEWGVRVGGKLPSGTGDFVQKVIFRNSPEKIEVKVGKSVYLIVFHPLPEQECVNISGFDISDQKELEEKLRENEENYRNLIEIANEGIHVIDAIDAEYRNTYVNEKMAEMLGYSREELIGKSVRDFTDENGKIIFEQNMKKRRQGINESHEFKYIRKDGSPLWTLVNSKALFDKNGKFMGSLSMLTDITERKRAEEEVQEAKKMLQLIMDNIPQAIFWKDCNSRYLGCNKVFVEDAGVQAPENIIGKTDYDLPWTREQSEWYRECDRRVMKNDIIEYHIIEPQTTADGELTWLDTNKIPLHDAKGNVIGILGTYEDITERKRAEEALKKAHNALEEKVEKRTKELKESYNSLKEREISLAEAQGLAQIGNWEWDIATDKAYWSNELYRIFGRSPQESAPTYNEFLNYIHPDDRLHFDNAANKALYEKSSLSIDLRIILAGGEERTVHMQTEIIFNETNNPVQIKGIVQDITEREKAEEKIRHLANVVESSGDAIGTLSLDGIVTSWNKGAEQIYRYSAQEILGKHISLPAPNYLKGETQEYVELIKQTGMSYKYISSRVRKDGEVIDVSINLSPVFDNHRKLTAISFITRDITELKKSEEKLRKSEKKYRNIVETANEGICLVDAENILAYVNKKLEDICGYSTGELIGKSIWDFIFEEDKPIIKLIVEKELQGFNESCEFKLRRKDGSLRWMFLNSKPFFDDDGRHIGGLGMLTDITERKKAEEALKMIDISRKQEIHHRIKNNLQVISSLLDLQAEKLKNRKCNNDCQMECIRNSEVIDAFKESQDRVISMALIHEELHKGGELNTLNFSSYIKELTDNLFLSYRLGNEGIGLDMDIEDDIYFDMDTSVPLGIIINELVSNSLKHAFSGRDNGEIRIKLQRQENGECEIEDSKSTTFTLSIADNGVSIPEDFDIEDFDSLGLQLVTTLVDQLDGELELRRDNGTKFTIRFMVTENNNSVSVPTTQQSF